MTEAKQNRFTAETQRAQSFNFFASLRPLSLCGEFFFLLLLAGCAVGPNYQRPAVSVPDQYRGAQSPDNASLADTKWFDLFQDEPLKQLVAAALEHNFDLAIASERILEARAQFRIVRAARFPLVTADASYDSQRPSYVGTNPPVPEGSLNFSYAQLGTGLSWELDLWGRIRRLNESARAQYLATEEARRGVIVSLIGDVMGGYFTLRERDLELEIGRQTRDTAADSLRLVELRHSRGAATGLDVHQAEQLLYTATAQIASNHRDIEQAQNAISFLAGRAPGDVSRGKTLDEFKTPPAIPAGLPSSLVDRRPDIREAEQRLVAANAQIGAAKALYFPRISLTAFLGTQSRELTNLFTTPALLATATSPDAFVPIFNAGQTGAAVRLTEAQKRELVVTYRKTIYNALREVSDALTSYGRTREERAQEELLVQALAESTRLSTLRYKGGLDSYLQVLDAQRNLFRGQLTLAQLRLQELLSYVELYRALGGGWQ